MALIESERILGLAHADLLAHLEEHPPTNQASTEQTIDLGDYEVDLSPLGKFSYHATAQLTPKKEKEPHRLYAIELSLSSSKKQTLPPCKRTLMITRNIS